MTCVEMTDGFENSISLLCMLGVYLEVTVKSTVTLIMTVKMTFQHLYSKVVFFFLTIANNTNTTKANTSGYSV